jgi:DNA-binding PadR family transcriptional regulator
MRHRIFQIDFRGPDGSQDCGHHHHGRWRRDGLGEGWGRGFEGGFESRGGGWRARRGEARYLVLDVLKDGPMHGYEIIKTLEERTGGEWAPSPGTVYPTLQYLEELGLIEAQQEGERKAFRLTDKGRAELEARAEELQAFWDRFEGNRDEGSAELGFIRDEVGTLIKTLWRGLRQRDTARDKERLRKIRAEIEAAREKIRQILDED